MEHQDGCPKKVCDERGYCTTLISEICSCVTFPASKEGILSQYGNKEVKWIKGNPTMLSNIFDNITEEEFNTPEDLETALRKEYEQEEKE